MTVRTVLVVHGEALVAEGLTAALAAYPGLAPLRPVLSAAQARAHAGRVDAVALDDRLPGARDLAADLRRSGSRVVTIGAPSADEDDEVRVSTDAPVASLAQALAPGLRTRPSAELSDQQRRVLTLVARGLTARQIGTRLGLSPKTVEQHKSRIFRKLDVPNQAAAVRAALAMGLGGVA